VNGDLPQCFRYFSLISVLHSRTLQKNPTWAEQVAFTFTRQRRLSRRAFDNQIQKAVETQLREASMLSQPNLNRLAAPRNLVIVDTVKHPQGLLYSVGVSSPRGASCDGKNPSPSLPKHGARRRLASRVRTAWI
jgi:hypothetical protein